MNDERISCSSFIVLMALVDLNDQLIAQVRQSADIVDFVSQVTRFLTNDERISCSSFILHRSSFSWHS
jgi:hypothetical protein